MRSQVMAGHSSTHVIFDVGGTIADIADIFNNIFDKYAHNLGKQWKIDPYLAECESIRDLCRDFLIKIGVDSCELDERTNEVVQMIYNSFRSNGIPMVPGVQKLIQHLYDHNIPMAIATNGRQREVDMMSCIKGFNVHYISHFVCGADDPEVKNIKPSPDVFLVCAKRFKIPMKSLENCVIFEDSVRGITGAVASGMKSVLINQRPDLDCGSIGHKITLIVDSFVNFKPESVGLPPYK